MGAACPCHVQPRFPACSGGGGGGGIGEDEWFDGVTDATEDTLPFPTLAASESRYPLPLPMDPQPVTEPDNTDLISFAINLFFYAGQSLVHGILLLCLLGYSHFNPLHRM